MEYLRKNFIFALITLLLYCLNIKVLLYCRYNIKILIKINKMHLSTNYNLIAIFIYTLVYILPIYYNEMT